MLARVMPPRETGSVYGALARLLAAVLCGFFAGWWVAGAGSVSDPASTQVLRGELQEAREAAREVRHELQAVQTRADVDRQALAMVRGEIVAQKEQVMDLQDNLRFYRGLMSPASGAGGVSLRVPEIVRGPGPGLFEYRMVVQQVAAKHALVKGSLSVVVEGVLDGESVSMPLEELHDAEQGALPPLQFRYFQSLEGELRLPDGFQPQRLTVAAQLKKPKKVELREQYPWEIQERFSNVGK